MYFVKQYHAGWLGIVSDDGTECTSGVIVFNIADNDRRNQLIKYTPYKSEMLDLVRTLKRHLPHRTDYINFVESKINEA